MEGATALFYYRNGCHLCEEMAAMLFRDWPEQAAAIEWRDVDACPEWRQAYGERVPVLIHGGQLVCDLIADTARIERYFGDRANPV